MEGKKIYHHVQDQLFICKENERAGVARKKFHLSRRTSGGLTFLLRFPPKAHDEKVLGFVPCPLKVVHLRSPKTPGVIPFPY